MQGGISAPWYITNPESVVTAISEQIEYNNMVKRAWELIAKSDYKNANDIIISLNADEDYRAREETILLRDEMYKYFPKVKLAGICEFSRKHKKNKEKKIMHLILEKKHQLKQLSTHNIP